LRPLLLPPLRGPPMRRTRGCGEFLHRKSPRAGSAAGRRGARAMSSDVCLGARDAGVEPSLLNSLALFTPSSGWSVAQAYIGILIHLYFCFLSFFSFLFISSPFLHCSCDRLTFLML